MARPRGTAQAQGRNMLRLLMWLCAQGGVHAAEQGRVNSLLWVVLGEHCMPSRTCQWPCMHTCLAAHGIHPLTPALRPPTSIATHACAISTHHGTHRLTHRPTHTPGVFVVPPEGSHASYVAVINSLPAFPQPEVGTSLGLQQQTRMQSLENLVRGTPPGGVHVLVMVMVCVRGCLRSCWSHSSFVGGADLQMGHGRVCVRSCQQTWGDECLLLPPTIDGVQALSAIGA